MKKRISLTGAVILMSTLLFSQTEKEINSQVKQVTVFTRGAQIAREAKLSVPPGKTVLKFTGLSPYIDKESIHIDGDGSFTILTVQHANDYLNELEKDRAFDDLSDKIDDLDDLIEEEEVWIKILNEKLDFLQVNKNISGEDQALDPETFRLLNSMYGENLESLNLDLFKRKRKIRTYREEISKLKQQITSMNNEQDLPSGIIRVTVEAEKALNTKIHFNYLVEKASWYPSYDMRYRGIEQPMQITCKANIIQNTGIDWTDVELVLSTAKTNLSAVLPVLNPFYLQFYYPEIMQSLQGRVPGVATEMSDQVVIGYGVEKKGPLYGLNDPLYIVDGIPRDNLDMINPTEISSMQIVKDASAKAIYGTRGANGVVLVSTKSGKDKSSVPMTLTTQQETITEYSVASLQSIPSVNKTTTIAYRESELEADFEYQAIPKLSEHVYLMAQISDWHKAGLTDGEVNVYLENSYVGKSRIFTGQFNDTLEISFGIDNNLNIKREKLSEYRQNQFLGSNRKETVAYKITLRNNKPYRVTTTITDQVPVSTIRDIQVDILELSGGTVEEDTGAISWEVSLEPNENKELIVKYTVKYPKDQRLIVE